MGLLYVGVSFFYGKGGWRFRNSRPGDEACASLFRGAIEDVLGGVEHLILLFWRRPSPRLSIRMGGWPRWAKTCGLPSFSQAH
jgi:hypothetical protein